MHFVDVNFDKLGGKIKPMHAVNDTPTVPYDTSGLFSKMQEAAIPYSRLHDTGGAYGGSRYVDIPNVFPDFDADENDPASYDFAFTDVLMKEIVKYGMKPFYRLGVTIENYHKIKPYNILVPKDFAKWARICEHIIRHYNEGWADGYYMNIEYWEIWNEPDNEPEIEDNPMWRGTKEQFFELYEIASKHLKKCFPHLKIGGYGSCGFYALTNSFIEAANSSPRRGYFLEFFDAFLEYAKAHDCVIDFFSWHSYAALRFNVYYATYAREKMDAAGYTECEIFLNEWNPGPKYRGQMRDASEVLSMMCALHDTPTDMCMYYQVQLYSGYCGIFNPVGYTVLKAYYAFYGFGKLYTMGTRAECVIRGEELYGLAAVGDGKKGILLVNHTDVDMPVSLNLTGADGMARSTYAVDADHEWDFVECGDEMVIPPYGIRYVEFA